MSQLIICIVAILSALALLAVIGVIADTRRRVRAIKRKISVRELIHIISEVI